MNARQDLLNLRNQIEVEVAAGNEELAGRLMQKLADGIEDWNISTSSALRQENNNEA